MHTSERDFLARYPAYAAVGGAEALRAHEYARLDQGGQVYLDYTGAGLYAASQVTEHQRLLLSGVYGNPHSSNPTSQAATDLVEHTRRAVLDHFNADPAEYVVIFTANASGALKLVGEAFPFGPGGRFLLIFDNHNSVNGIREFARAKGAEVIYSPVMPPDLRIDANRLRAYLQARATAPVGSTHLFAYPAQSNFSGVKHDLGWVAEAQALGWDVLLDAAAFAPTNRLDLSRVCPDFISLSFYKMFGYPTGVGALIARRPALARLHRPWFAGGTISMASVQADRHYLHEGAEGFEDGTLDYLNLPAVAIGLRHLASVGIEAINTRVSCLTDWLLAQMRALAHANGAPKIKIYGPLTTDARGATITFNVFDADGHFVDHRLIEARANAAGISLRTGCFCNPGGGELALGIPAEELTGCLLQHAQRMTYDDFRRCFDDRSTGAVRVSLGIASTWGDVQALLNFLETV
jgi:selenocysteine lyase/cysteine desulfurase